ncbi:MAG TPA: histidine kinase [Asanoa sp.]|nr:histidine kinase [Asanoa sp.]
MLRNARRGFALVGLVLVQVPLVVLIVAVLLQAAGLAAIPLFPTLVGLVRRLAELHRRLVGEWTGVSIESPYLPAPPPPTPLPDGWYRYERMLYRSPRFPAWRARFRWMLGDPGTWRDVLWLLSDPLVKLALVPGFAVLPGRTLRFYGRWSTLLLAPGKTRRLASEVERLDAVRNRAEDSQSAEMRRIERDLHDGTQARLVAIGMTVAAAEELVETSPEQARMLLERARDGLVEALAELRRVVKGINPPVLAERGLADAVRGLALDSPLKVRVGIELPERLPAPIESAVYFAVSELLSNAAKHTEARTATVEIRADEDGLRVRVGDDGGGGADPAHGTGLLGIQRRIAAFDGLTSVDSPPGGPTTVILRVPGVRVAPGTGKATRVPPWETAVVVACWSVGWLPLFPQGLVAAGSKLTGNTNASWFLPLHLSDPWQWPAIIGMIALGLAMYALAIWLPARRSRTLDARAAR